MAKPQNADAKQESSSTLRLDSASAQGELKDLGGSKSDDWNLILLNQAFASLWTAHSDSEGRQKQLVATAMAMGGIKPNDEIEGMIAAQMIGLHSASMECLRRAMVKEQTFEGRRENLNQANKLSRTYAALVEALNRHRGKGQQKVTVEHVHVHAGGQAVVGVIEPPGGGNSKSEEQPHAKQIANAPIAAMRSQGSEWEALQIPCDGERALPDARGSLPRCTEGE
jgi:hypothetical protein